MNPDRRDWNADHRQLRRALATNDPSLAIDLFLGLHARLHSRRMSGSGLWSFEDEIWHGLSEADARRRPPGEEHSIAWTFLHIARIEDITMNVLVAGTGQLFLREDWARRMNTTIRHSGNKLDAAQMDELGERIQIDALRTYRMEVGRATRQVVKKLLPQELNHQVDPARLQALLDDGAVNPDAMEIIDYWSTRTIAGLLLMPPTRHSFLHLNEARRIKSRLYPESTPSGPQPEDAA